MDASGGPWRQLTSGPAADAHPVWSPDATPGAGRIAFASNRDGDWEIYLLALSTGTVRQLTDNDAWDGLPAWSPTGSHLVFVSDRAGDDDLFLVDVETGAETQLTTSPHDETHPAWSPQGDKIAHTFILADGGRLRHELVILHISEPDRPWQVVEGASSQVDRRLPAWSPDGEWLVFVSGRDGNAGLYLVPAAGGPAMKLLDMPGIGTARPAWSR
jgi:TolB protein